MPEVSCSVIIPCRNEARFIESCLDSVLSTTYPLDELEVIVVDGMSDDGTREVLAAYAKRHPVVRMLDNLRRITPCALNIAVTNARGPVIIRLDAHNIYPPEYIGRSIDILNSSGADCVGGVWLTEARDRTLLAPGVEVALSHPLGVGNSMFRVGVDRPLWVDAIPFGCMRKDLFSTVGLFNESLDRSQDMDFWSRVRQAGGRILLDPSITSRHLARGTVDAFARHNFWNGYWVTWPIRQNRTRFALRHLAPLIFCGMLLALTVVGLFWAPSLWLAAALAAAYFSAVMIVSITAAVRRRDGRILLAGPMAFAILHFSYGIGSLWGLIKPVRPAASSATPQ